MEGFELMENGFWHRQVSDGTRVRHQLAKAALTVQQLCELSEFHDLCDMIDIDLEVFEVDADGGIAGKIDLSAYRLRIQ